jgi:hypothetical protein
MCEAQGLPLAGHRPGRSNPELCRSRRARRRTNLPVTHDAELEVAMSLHVATTIHCGLGRHGMTQALGQRRSCSGESLSFGMGTREVYEEKVPSDHTSTATPPSTLTSALRLRCLPLNPTALHVRLTPSPFLSPFRFGRSRRSF